ncbi:MAG TPA: hypothetical protein VD948_08605 [Rhodothermales bacterium]|nr:hypothetical protein [Rhodothermales bacterium]
MSLTDLIDQHERRAAQEGPMTYALLKALRWMQDGREWNEGDLRDWIAEGETMGAAADEARAFLSDPAPTYRIEEHGDMLVPTLVHATSTTNTTAADRMAKARAAKALKAGQRA